MLSPSVAAVLAWLPHAPTQALRRLQQAAQRHGCVLWVFRPLSAQAHATPAVLRLHASAHTCPGWLEVGVLKRRGPPLAQPLQLPSPDLGLQATLAGARWLRAQHRQPSVSTATSVRRTASSPSHHDLVGTESLA